MRTGTCPGVHQGSDAERDGSSGKVRQRGVPSVGLPIRPGILPVSLRPDALNSRRSRPPHHCDPVAGRAPRASMSTSRRRTTHPSLATYQGPALAMPGPVDSDRPGGRNFPLPVVIGHGIFATATVVLVVPDGPPRGRQLALRHEGSQNPVASRFASGTNRELPAMG